MEANNKFYRSFLIFSQEDMGYGHNGNPAGYVKIEAREGKGKLHISIQNLKENREGSSYKAYIMRCNGKDIYPVCAGVIPYKGSKGELQWEFNPGNVANSGVTVEGFNIAAVILDNSNAVNKSVICPLVAYKDKKVQWRDKFQEIIYKAQTKMEDNAEEIIKKHDVFSKYDTQFESKYVKTDVFPELDMKDSKLEPINTQENVGATADKDKGTDINKDKEEEENKEKEKGKEKEENIEKEKGKEEEENIEKEKGKEKEENIEKEKDKEKEENKEKEKGKEKEENKEKESAEKKDIKDKGEVKKQEKAEAVKEAAVKNPDLGEMNNEDNALNVPGFSNGQVKVDELKMEQTVQGNNIPNPGTCTLMNGNYCNPQLNGNFQNPCMNCSMKAPENNGPLQNGETGERAPSANMDKFRKNLDSYFEASDPFMNNRRDYKWWKVSNPVQLNNIFYQCGIKTPLFFNPSVMMAHYKYRYLIVGIYSDRMRRHEYIVCGIPGVYGIDDKPFGDLCRWIQVEGNKPRYGAYGYWLVYIDPKTGRFLGLN